MTANNRTKDARCSKHGVIHRNGGYPSCRLSKDAENTSSDDQNVNRRLTSATDGETSNPSSGSTEFTAETSKERILEEVRKFHGTQFNGKNETFDPECIGMAIDLALKESKKEKRQEGGRVGNV